VASLSHQSGPISMLIKANMLTFEVDTVNQPHPPDTCLPIRHDDIATLLRPVQVAAPALFMALRRCLTVLQSGDVGEDRLCAIAEAENALRLGERS